MNCPNCGSNLLDKGNYCPYCGTRLQTDQVFKIDSKQEILDHARIEAIKAEEKKNAARERTKRFMGCFAVIIVWLILSLIFSLFLMKRLRL